MKCSGFTLIEVVISLAIITILGTSIISANLNLNQSRLGMQKIEENNRLLHNTMEKVSANIKNGMGYSEVEGTKIVITDINDDLVEILVESEDGHELKKIVQKGIYTH